MKFLLNKAFGGVGFYDKKFVDWCKKYARDLIVQCGEGDYFDYSLDEFAVRTDPRLIEFVESGQNKGTAMEDLVVVEVPDDVSLEKYYIHNYDGIETLHENHRSW